MADLWNADMADSESLTFKASYAAYNTLWALGTRSAAYRTPIQLALASGSAIKAWFTDPDALGEWLGDICTAPEVPELLEGFMDDLENDQQFPEDFDWARLAKQVWDDLNKDFTHGPISWGWAAPEPTEPEDPQ